MEANNTTKRENLRTDHDWKDICAKCRDGDIEPEFCAYYREPNGCNSPIIGEHPTTEKLAVVGNAAAMREALETMNSLFERGVICTLYANSPEEVKQIEELYRRTKAALSAPPRNCDVGTAEEQEERYINLKREHIDRLTRCPAVGQSFFPDSLYWAQMPYEEGVAK